MYSRRKPSALAIVFIIAAISNATLFLGSMRRMLTKGNQRTYTWMNLDYPLDIPVGQVPTVEMTFHDSARYRMADVDSWKTLTTNQLGNGFQHLGPFHFRYISGAYHSLHCIYNMHAAFDKGNHLATPDHHLHHCMVYLRQIFLCLADMTLEEGDFMMRNLTMDRMGETRRCRDWTTVGDYVNQNTKEWAEYNGISMELLTHNLNHKHSSS